MTYPPIKTDSLSPVKTKQELRTYTAIGLRDDVSPVKAHFSKHQNWLSSAPNARVLAPPTPPPEHSDYRQFPLPHLSDGVIPPFIDSRRSSEASRRASSTSSTGSSKGYLGGTLDTKKLVEIASKLSCFFWFESAFVLHRVSENPELIVHDALHTLSFPTERFEKWLYKVIHTTQVSQGVVLLALLFIFRLKMLNPTVKGKPGSEERLLTCALMLGNKYLDDNTYTNGTWADVSGYPVEDIHVMEIEFLSNMKFNLYTSKSQWEEWQGKIEKFLAYYELAAQRAQTIRTSPGHVFQHSNPLLPSLPSPPLSETQYSTPTSPVSADMGYAQADHRPPMRLAHNAPVHSIHLNSRKRGREELPPFEHRTKRVATEAPHMPMRSQYVPVTAPPMQLEPPVGVSHSGYQGSQPFYLPPLPILPSNAPPSISFYSDWKPPQFTGVPSAPTTHNINIPTLPPSYRPANEWQPPMSSSTYIPSLAVTTPITMPSSACSSRQSSPYGYNRSSPYRPVREVNTLLIPPPSTPLHIVPSSRQNITYNTLTASRGQTQHGTIPYLSQSYSWPLLF